MRLKASEEQEVSFDVKLSSMNLVDKFLNTLRQRSHSNTSC